MPQLYYMRYAERQSFALRRPQCDLSGRSRSSMAIEGMRPKGDGRAIRLAAINPEERLAGIV